ncbi:MAG: glycoside hydrolase family 108 protein [Candidatus Binataceae bacterium]
MADTAPAYSYAFLDAVVPLLDVEGGYVDNPEDPGGETKFGISARYHPGVDIKNLTRDEAIAIYWSEWWLAYHYDQLEPRVAAKMLQMAPLIGPANAAICLQRACRANGRTLAEDGVVGELTRDYSAALALHNFDALRAAMRSEFAAYFRAKDALERGHRPEADEPFLKGWLTRAYE